MRSNNQTSLDREIKEIVAKKLRIDIGSISRKDNFFKDLNADLLDVVEIIVDVECKYKIAFPDVLWYPDTVEELIQSTKNTLNKNVSNTKMP